jgi:hypothetical protein
MAAALKKPEPDTPPATVSVIIARGRSAMYHMQTGTTIGVDGRPVPVLVNKIAAPGETIEVAAHEVPHLISTGFIVDPNAPPPPAADDQKDGPTKIELHEEMPGNYGLQRMGSRTDPW